MTEKAPIEAEPDIKALARAIKVPKPKAEEAPSKARPRE
jgi:hypothetical protein